MRHRKVASMAEAAPVTLPKLRPLHERVGPRLTTLDAVDFRIDELLQTGVTGRELLHAAIGVFEAATPWPGTCGDASERVDALLHRSGEPAELWPTYRRMLLRQDVLPWQVQPHWGTPAPQ